MQQKCCSLFNDIDTFMDIRHAHPPDTKGVYIIRIKERGASIYDIVRQGKEVIDRIDWPLVSKNLTNRINRINQIGSCSIIYIGRAGHSRTSKNTLSGRYAQLAYGHTVMCALWTLLYFGWELEYGWKVADNPEDLEGEFKLQYQKEHLNKLPSLVNR